MTVSSTRFGTLKGLILFTLGQYNNALEAIEQALAINPQQQQAWYYKGLALCNLTKYDDAIKSFNKVLEINPRDSEALCNIGLSLNKLQNYTEAIRSFDEALRVSPKYGEAFYGRAISNAKMNKLRNAVADLEKAIEIGKVDDRDFYRIKAKEDRLRDIKGILDRANGVQALSKSSQAYQMFSEGKSPMDAAIALDMREPEVTQLYKESWTLKQLYDLNSIYLETKGDLGPFVKLYKLSKEAGLNTEHVIKILRLADDDLLRLEGKYYNLKSEVKSLEAKREGLIRIIRDYDNQVKALGKSFDSYCRLCQEEESRLTDLQRQRLKAEALVSHFQNNNEEYVKIRNVVEHKVYSTLSNVALLLKLAVSSVIHSIRNNPEQYVQLIQDNFSPMSYNTPSHPFYIAMITLCSILKLY